MIEESKGGWDKASPDDCTDNMHMAADISEREFWEDNGFFDDGIFLSGGQ